MRLEPGHTLGPYEIIEPIGKGGMGEVYKARDTRLNRDVAIKVSAERFSERFEREARVIASLNHPNICTLFDIGPNYLVMEYIQGESPKGPLPVDTVIDYARQMADALDCAHEKAVTHRDLKPANLKITPEGKLKVLDFGLAKVGRPARQEPQDENSPTLTMGMTEVGMILGTASYMAPEQAKGKEVDKRADIWAFGVVLYELSTGKRLFKGEDVSDILASVLKEEPDFAAVPEQLRTLLRHCLEKDPKKRLRDIGDVVGLIGVGLIGQAPPPPAPPATRSFAPWIAAVAAAAAVGFAVLYWTRSDPAAAAVARFALAPPQGNILTANRSEGPQFAVSPDGKYVAFVADRNSKAGSQDVALWVRAMDSLRAQMLDNTAGAHFPFWSPDSKNIAFFAGGKLKRIPLSGGSPNNLADVSSPEGGTWFQPEDAGPQSEGVILFAPGGSGPIYRVLAGGGVPSPVTKIEQSEIGHTYPQILPDKRRFLYYVRSGAKPGIYVQALDSDQHSFLLGAPNRAVVGPPDFLLYLRDNTLLAQRWDWTALKPLSEPVAVADGIRSGSGGRNTFSVSSNGILAYRSGGVADFQYRWYSRDGTPFGNALSGQGFGAIEISPDNRRAIIVKSTGSGNDLWLNDVSSNVLSRLTSGSGNESMPIFSPDSRRLAFISRDASGRVGVYQTLIGSGKQTLVNPDFSLLEAWTRDGLVVRVGNTVSLISAPEENATAPATAKPRLLLDAKYKVDQFRVSPDGKWVAYLSEEGGESEVWVAAFPSFSDRRKVAEGQAPLWRADGKELVYVLPGKGLMVVDVKTGPTFESGPPNPLFDPATSRLESNTVYYYTMMNDAKQFLIREIPSAGSEEEQLYLVLNWPTLLDR